MEESEAMLPGVFKRFLDDWTVYVIDRPLDVPEGTSNADLAEAYYKEIVGLGIGPADIIGTSQGGMIAQHLAVSHPQAVHALVLCATLGPMNSTAEATIGGWIDFAVKGEWDSLCRDMFSKLYTDAYLDRYKEALDYMAGHMAPDDPVRFIRLAKACLSGGPAGRLDRITCPTLVAGGENDPVVSGEASKVLAREIGCELHIFEGVRHSFYDETRDFYDLAYGFLSGLYN